MVSAPVRICWFPQKAAGTTCKRSNLKPMLPITDQYKWKPQRQINDAIRGKTNLWSSVSAQVRRKRLGCKCFIALTQVWTVCPLDWCVLLQMVAAMNTSNTRASAVPVPHSRAIDEEEAEVGEQKTNIIGLISHSISNSRDGSRVAGNSKMWKRHFHLLESPHPFGVATLVLEGAQTAAPLPRCRAPPGSGPERPSPPTADVEANLRGQ